MRKFILFAALWAALFGSGHVLAACPMQAGKAAPTESQALCHPDQARASSHAGHEGGDTQGEGEHGTSGAATHGLDCCAWVAPAGSFSKTQIQKGTLLPADLLLALDAADAGSASGPAPLIRPPPLILDSSLLSLAPDSSGRSAFLVTGRLRL